MTENSNLNLVMPELEELVKKAEEVISDISQEYLDELKKEHILTRKTDLESLKELYAKLTSMYTLTTEYIKGDEESYPFEVISAAVIMGLLNTWKELCKKLCESKPSYIDMYRLFGSLRKMEMIDKDFGSEMALTKLKFITDFYNNNSGGDINDLF